MEVIEAVDLSKEGRESLDGSSVTLGVAPCDAIAARGSPRRTASSAKPGRPGRSRPLPLPLKLLLLLVLLLLLLLVLLPVVVPFVVVVVMLLPLWTAFVVVVVVVVGTLLKQVLLFVIGTCEYGSRGEGKRRRAEKRSWPLPSRPAVAAAAVVVDTAPCAVDSTIG